MDTTIRRPSIPAMHRITNGVLPGSVEAKQKRRACARPRVPHWMPAYLMLLRRRFRFHFSVSALEFLDSLFQRHPREGRTLYPHREFSHALEGK